MAVGKKSATIPVNMGDTFASLNNAASAPVQKSVSAPVAAPVSAPVRDEKPAPIQVTPEPVYPVNSVKSNGIPTVDQVEATAAKQEIKTSTASSFSTEKTMISLRLLKNDKEKFQEFFKSCGLSFTDGLYMAADFIEREVEAGRLQMSKSGIQYK